jgi:hypothetical protein
MNAYTAVLSLRVPRVVILLKFMPLRVTSTVWSGRNSLTFRRNLLSPCSESKRCCLLFDSVYGSSHASLKRRRTSTGLWRHVPEDF